MARRRYGKKTPKGNTYYQFRAGMRELMSVDPVRGMVHEAAAEVLSNIQQLSTGAYTMGGYVTSAPPRSEDISWHEFIEQADKRAVIDGIRYGSTQLGLANTYVNMGKR